MNESTVKLLRISMNLFALIMLLFPLVFVLFVTTKVEQPAARENARRRQLALTVFTLLAIAAWGSLALIASQTRIPAFEQIARMAWIGFFPLWFGLAMPAVIAKNPAWGAVCCPLQAGGPNIRTASLKPRNRENPIRNWHWALMMAVSLVPLTLLAVRGAFPFLPEGPASDSARFRWAMITGINAVCMLITLLIVPLSIRRSLVEPEPLDPAGSQELESMYQSERRNRILSLFWLLGVVQPLVLGIFFNAVVWSSPASGRTLGIIGAIVGTSIGIAGSVIGTVASIRRVRIAEERARLESATDMQ